MTLTECQAAQVKIPSLGKASCLHQMLTFHLQWGEPLASEQSTSICSPEYPLLRIWGPALQTLSSAWIPPKRRRNPSGLCHPDQGETWKTIHFLSAESPSLPSPSHPLMFSSQWFLKWSYSFVYFLASCSFHEHRTFLSGSLQPFPHA